jgi:SMODS and SLOG-associating 2TM effector domain 1
MRADAYDCEDDVAIKKIQEQLINIEQSNNLDLIQYDTSKSSYASKDISTWDEMTFDQYLEERGKEQISYYERKIAEKEALVKTAKRTMRISGIVSALIAVVGAYFNLSILISLIALVGMSIQYFNERLKYKEELSKYHAAHKQVKIALLRRGLVSDKELVNICEQTFRAENGSWQQLWATAAK